MVLSGKLFLVEGDVDADHLKYGKTWYVVLRFKRHGAVVGVMRNGVVTTFSKAAKDDFINYVREEVIGLI
jgi:hypothetical protein